MLLSTAATDNMQWNLSQAEVEFLKLEAEALTASGPEDLRRLRRQFDIYYSRITTFRESPLFADVRESESGAPLLSRAQKRLDRLAEVIDGSDTALLEGLPGLREDLAGNRADVRELALFGVVLQAGGFKGRRG